MLKRCALTSGVVKIKREVFFGLQYKIYIAKSLISIKRLSPLIVGDITYPSENEVEFFPHFSLTTINPLSPVDFFLGRERRWIPSLLIPLVFEAQKLF